MSAPSGTPSRMAKPFSVLLLLFTIASALLALADGPKKREPVSALPPMASEPDPGPSRVIFPQESIPLKFDHKLHLAKGAACTDCHRNAKTSHRSEDSLLPGGNACDSCHGTNHEHASTGGVERGASPLGECQTCHLGDAQHPARVVVPPPNLKFDHAKHAARNIGCPQCHGDLNQVGLATRHQLPRMRGCLNCHDQGEGASHGDAKSECTTCHVETLSDTKILATGKMPTIRAEGAKLSGLSGGKMQTVFAQGRLVPPVWLNGAAHTPDFLERHRMIAGNDSRFCANCHSEDFCTSCHDARVRPIRTHPSDYLTMHAVDARLEESKCASCHQTQSFCLACHQRVGVSMSGPVAYRESSRFHPPKSLWSDLPKTGAHHAFEAERNLASCVSCHMERDCVACHGASGRGGGFSPHRADFLASCASMYRKNARPCLVCHEQGDRSLAQCR